MGAFPLSRSKMPDYPVTRRTDVLPGPNPTAKKDRGESFDEAMNPPNNPTKNHHRGYGNKDTLDFNITHDYCDDED